MSEELDNASDIRFRFNEAIAGGASMDGDAGPFIRSEGHASQLEMAISRIAQLEAERDAALEKLDHAWIESYEQGIDDAQVVIVGMVQTLGENERDKVLWEAIDAVRAIKAEPLDD